MDIELKELLKEAFDQGAIYEATLIDTYSFDAFVKNKIEKLNSYSKIGGIRECNHSKKDFVYDGNNTIRCKKCGKTYM